jgi:hypothetical protein
VDAVEEGIGVNYDVSNPNLDVLSTSGGQVTTTTPPPDPKPPGEPFDFWEWLKNPVGFLGGAVTGGVLVGVGLIIWLAKKG